MYAQGEGSFVESDNVSVEGSHCKPIVPWTIEGEPLSVIILEAEARTSSGIMFNISSALADHFVKLKPESENKVVLT